MDTQVHPLVSVVVPVYKAEAYITRCIESILAQTYNNLELILVDDGSPDQSGRICDEYTEIDCRVKVIHTPNQGVSCARNTGIDHATGDYLMFVDSDDWILNNHIEQLIPSANEDWICCGIRFYKNGQFDRFQCSPENTIHREQWCSDFARFWSVYGNNSPCRCGYKHSIIREHHLRFQCGISIGEDELFNLNYILHSHILRYIESCTYCYETGVEGTLMGKHHPDRNESSVKVVQTMERISQKPEYFLRWREWNTAIRHHSFHFAHRTGDARKAVIQHLKCCYQEPYFRECIPYMRKEGTLDQKVETYFMRYWLHPLYQPFYKLVVLLSRAKRAIVRR